MTSYVALLCAGNVGGTGKLAMSDLKALCEAAGFEAVRTLIASGNVVFRSGRGETEIKADLETRLLAHMGKQVRILVRTGAEIADVLARNPFPDAPGDRVVAIFLDAAPPPDTCERATGRADDEHIRLGRRELYVRYGAGMGQSKLRIPAAKGGTARNMNTVAKLVALAGT